MEMSNLAPGGLLVVKSYKPYICAVAFFLGGIGEVS